MSTAHADDIGAVAARLRAEASVPVWLIGTSMGTFSAAGGAIGARGIDGLVLTSTITRAKPNWKIAASHPNGVASMALPRATVPPSSCRIAKTGATSRRQRTRRSSGPG